MVTCKELKSSKYLDKTIDFAGKLLSVDFTKTSDNKYSSFCPFHKDTKDSFRVYDSEKDEVRFHCFGACSADWDIFDLIQKKIGSSFREAQNKFAQYLKEDIQILDSATPPAPENTRKAEEESVEDEPSVSFNEPVELDPRIYDALETAARVPSS